jgi:hypothetical protein
MHLTKSYDDPRINPGLGALRDAQPWEIAMSIFALRCLSLLTVLVLSRAAIAAEKPVCAWDCGGFASGSIACHGNGHPLLGTGTVETVGERKWLLVNGGEQLTTTMENGPLATGKPFAIEIEFMTSLQPSGYHGGLLEASSYNESGLRILLQQDFRISVELFPGAGKDPVYFVSANPVSLGVPQMVRFEHDGEIGRLSINKAVVVTQRSPPPAAWDGIWRLGEASGNSYYYNGRLGVVRYTALVP